MAAPASKQSLLPAQTTRFDRDWRIRTGLGSLLVVVAPHLQYQSGLSIVASPIWAASWCTRLTCTPSATRRSQSLPISGLKRFQPDADAEQTPPHCFLRVTPSCSVTTRTRRSRTWKSRALPWNATRSPGRAHRPFVLRLGGWDRMRHWPTSLEHEAIPRYPARGVRSDHQMVVRGRICWLTCRGSPMR